MSHHTPNRTSQPPMMGNLQSYKKHLSGIWDNLFHLSSSEYMDEYVKAYHLVNGLQDEERQSLYDLVVHILREKARNSTTTTRTPAEYLERADHFVRILSYVNRHRDIAYPDFREVANKCSKMIPVQ